MQSFAEYSEIMKSMLQRQILPFWLNLIDHDNGGFYGYVDHTGEVKKDAKKGIILHSRILWTFSESYRFTGKKEYLDAATHCYRFLIDKAMDKRYGGLYWMLDGKGEPIEDFKHAYNQAFGVYALSTYYLASQSEEALSYALQLFRLIEEKWHDERGYLEQFTRDFGPMSNEELSENGIIADRTMNTILHVMEAYTVLYQATKNEEVGSALRFCVMQLTHEMFNEKKERLEVFFDLQFKSLLDLHSYGHDIEASWLIDRALDVLGDKKLTEDTSIITKKLYEHVMRQAFTSRGVYFECENGHDNTQRDWWVQAEAIIGMANDLGKFGDKSKHLAQMYEVLHFLQKEVILPNGEWYWTTYEDGTHDTSRELSGPWKCPYHNSRMCLEIMNRFR